MCINVVASLHKLRHRFEVYPINLIYRSKLAACRIFAHGMRSWANGSCAFLFFDHHCLQRKFSFSYFLIFIWYHNLRQENELYIALYSFTFKLWLRSYPQVLAAFNDLSEQGFVVKWWTTLVLHAWNARPPQGLGKVQMFYRTDLRPLLSKLVSKAVYRF